MVVKNALKLKVRTTKKNNKKRTSPNARLARWDADDDNGKKSFDTPPLPLPAMVAFNLVKFLFVEEGKIKCFLR
jgi:hypothetical protein